MPEVYFDWQWNRDYFESLAINREYEDNPYIQRFRDYTDKTKDADFSDFSIGIIK